MFIIHFKTRGMKQTLLECEFVIGIVVMFYCIVTIQMTVAVVHLTGESLMLSQK